MAAADIWQNDQGVILTEKERSLQGNAAFLTDLELPLEEGQTTTLEVSIERMNEENTIQLEKSYFYDAGVRFSNISWESVLWYNNEASTFPLISSKRM